jgi:hypothetical protein
MLTFKNIKYFSRASRRLMPVPTIQNGRPSGIRAGRAPGDRGGRGGETTGIGAIATGLWMGNKNEHIECFI